MELYSIIKENGNYCIVDTNNEKIKEDSDLDFVRSQLLELAANEFHKKATDAYNFGVCLNMHYEVRDDKVYKVKNETV